MLSALEEFIVQMRTGRETTRTYSADHLSLLNEGTDLHPAGYRTQMRIAGAEALHVTDLNDATERAPHSRPCHRPRSRSLDGGPVWRSVVDPEMRPIALEDRVIPTGRKTAGDPERYGIPKKHTPQRFGIHIEILPASPGTGVGYRLQYPFAISQLDREESAGAERAIRTTLALDRHSKRISGANVARKVDLPREHIRQVEYVLAEFVFAQFPVFAAEIGEPQARFDESREDHRVQAHGDFVHLGLPAGILGDEVQQRVRIQLQDDPGRLLTRVGSESRHQASTKRPRVLVFAHHLGECVGARCAHTIRRQELSKRLSGPQGVVLAHGR